MKTVPTIRLADSTDAVVLPDLPEEIALAMSDIAGAAREGLLAMSVAAGMAVMAAMFDAEIAEACGPKGKHNQHRGAVRHGSEKGSVTLGGRRISVTRPRARTLDGHEVPLSSYAHFAAEDVLTQVVMERMLAGLATRRHARAAEPVGEAAGVQKSTSKSAISRRFVRQTDTALAELMARDLSGEDITVLMLDGEHLAERCVVVALAITAEGTKKPVGLWDGSTENKTVVRALLADLVERGLKFDDGLLVVLDGAKALAAGVREVFGTKALIQRCTLHKRRNVAAHLPDKDKAWVEAKLVKAFGHPDPDQGLRNAKQLATQLDKRYPGASASLREGLQEMFTVARLGIDGRLAKTLTTSNPVESMISIARTTNRNVTRWRDGQMVLRWTAAGMLNAERSFRRIKGYKQMPQLVNALRRHTQPSATPNLSVPPPRIHHGSSPKFHETRDMLILPIGKRYRHACPFTSHCVGMFHNLQCNQSRVRSSERRRAATPTTSPDDQTAR